MMKIISVYWLFVLFLTSSDPPPVLFICTDLESCDGPLTFCSGYEYMNLR